jgi:hypothetical protein
MDTTCPSRFSQVAQAAEGTRIVHGPAPLRDPHGERLPNEFQGFERER